MKDNEFFYDLFVCVSSYIITINFYNLRIFAFLAMYFAIFALNLLRAILSRLMFFWASLLAILSFAFCWKKKLCISLVWIRYFLPSCIECILCLYSFHSPWYSDFLQALSWSDFEALSCSWLGICHIVLNKKELDKL